MRFAPHHFGTSIRIARRAGSSLIFSLILLLPSPSAFASDSYVHHDLKITLSPDVHRLSVADSITLPPDFSREFIFTLHGGLKPSSPTPLVRIEKQKNRQGAVLLETYKVMLPAGLHNFSIVYEGPIYHPLDQEGSAQARGMQDTPGIISAEGAVLSGSSGWYPDLGSQFVTFDLEVKLPPFWDAVSQGSRVLLVQGSASTLSRWSSPEPQESIFLIAARFTHYLRTTGQFTAMVFLRTSDEAMADKYLDATARYVEMYSKLIGPYPYWKFALVENFWETGFGMPSFTLLGPKVIRLPFIINSSYPHEILHNWWGNSVFPDYEKGNWSEGITAYLADHLIKEQQGAGAEYRVNTLQKYADYVIGNRDFPLTQFRSRHSSSSEAIGYGKSLMFFHMLRQELGDEVFTAGIREFYKEFRFKFADWTSIRAGLEKVSAKDLKQEFDQWVSRTGAPQLQLRNAKTEKRGDGYAVTALIKQLQPGEAYHLAIPVAVTMEGQEQAFQTVVLMKDKETLLDIPLPARPLRLDIDPEFDLFRRLDQEEIPPAISQVLGSKKMLIILPSQSDRKLLKAYKELAQGLGRSGPDKVEVKLDSQLKKLPQDRSITVIGWENRFLGEMVSALSDYGIAMTPESVRISQANIPKQNHSFVLSARIPGKKERAMLFIASDKAEALPGLGQKLPHYHKYSYLAFEGQEPANIAKGRWPVLHSPLTVLLPREDGSSSPVETGKLAPRTALAVMPPVYSKERMLETVKYLSSADLKGRELGTAELDKAADAIAAAFKQAGLAPGGDEGSYFQQWEDSRGKTRMKNVVAVIPGKKPGYAGQSVVIGAHYDHLGLGMSLGRSEDKGKTHPGADDNAGGVAVLLELAKKLKEGLNPDRSIVFIAFTGEEEGKLGSRWYATHAQRFPVSQCIGMVNLDTVGRLGKRKLLVIGAGSAKEWVHILRGVGFVTGVEIEPVSEDLDSSDQTSFLEAGVPAIQLFSGPHLDYHRPTDTAEKIDADGLVKVASVAKEIVEYLAGRDGSLTALAKPGTSSGPLPGTERKVSLGTIPDFSYNGKGYRLSGVVPGSPAEAAELKEGDVIVQVNDSLIGNIRDLSNLLKTLMPGDKIVATYTRDGNTKKADIMLKER